MTRDLFGKEPDRGRFGDEAAPIDGPQLDLVLHHETHTNEGERGALLVSEDGTEARAVWLPKAAVHFIKGQRDISGIKRSGQIVRLPVITVTVPERLAKEKGLI